MKGMKRIAVTATAAVMALGSVCAFTACKDDAKYADTDDVTKVLMWIHKTEEEAEGGVYYSLAEKFNNEGFKAKNGKTIEVILESQMSPENLASQLQAAKTTGDRYPDVLALDAPKIAQYVDDEYIKDIDTYVSSEERADFKSSVIEQATIGGKLYALSAMEAPTALFYNKDLVTEEVLTAAGITTGFATVQKPWTWEQLANVCEVLKTRSTKPETKKSEQISIFYGFGGNAGDLYMLSPIVYSAGGEIIGSNGKMEGALDSEASAGALAELERVEPYRYKGESKTAIATGDVAFAVHGPWLINDVENAYNDKVSKIGAMPLPVSIKPDGTKGTVKSGCGSWCLAMSFEPRFEDTAATVIKYFTSAKASMEFFDAIGTFPTHNSCYTDPNMNENVRKGVYGDVAVLMDFAQPRPKTVNCGNIEQAFKDIVGKIKLSNGYDKAALKGEISTIARRYDVYSN